MRGTLNLNISSQRQFLDRNTRPRLVNRQHLYHRQPIGNLIGLFCGQTDEVNVVELTGNTPLMTWTYPAFIASKSFMLVI